MSMRVVLDTNCLISALLFKKGRLAVLRPAWRDGIITPLLCRESADELIRVLAYPKFGLDREEIEIILAEILPFAEIFHVQEPESTVAGLDDLADAVFVHLAKQSGAEALVSGDAHLLRLREPDLKILSPADFLHSLDFNNSRANRL